MMMLMLRRKMLTLRTRMLRRKTVEARTQTYTLCEPAQWKCTSTCHKSHTIRKFTGKNAADQSEHPDQAPAFTSTVRTPQCGLTVWGTNRQTATACKRVTSGLLDLSLARAHGHPGTTRSTGTRAQPRSTGTRRQGETRPREGGHTVQHRQARQDPIQHRHPCGETMGDKKGRQDVEKADAPSNTGTHVGRQWETMGSMGEKGRQDFVKVDTPSNTGTHVGRQWA